MAFNLPAEYYERMLHWEINSLKENIICSFLPSSWGKIRFFIIHLSNHLVPLSVYIHKSCGFRTQQSIFRAAEHSTCLGPVTCLLQGIKCLQTLNIFPICCTRYTSSFSFPFSWHRVQFIIVHALYSGLPCFALPYLASDNFDIIADHWDYLFHHMKNDWIS
jgi:hypothetical protein